MTPTPPSALRRDRPSPFALSVVVPCFNEDAVVAATHAQLVSDLGQLDDAKLEIIYVDDGSRDRTPFILADLQRSDARVRVIRFSRNFGHQIAVTAGLEHASGDAVAIIDADLQDPPAVIREFVARWQEGYDVAYGVRTERPGESAFKRLTASLFYRAIQRMSDSPIPVDVGDFRLLDRRVVEALRRMPERHRFVRGMVSWVGFSQVEVPYRRDPRLAGESKYPLWKMLRFALDGVTSFSTFPLRMATWLGFIASGVAVAGIIYGLAVRLLTKQWVAGWAALFTAVLFIGGVQLLSLGVIGEYVGRIFAEVKGRPLYLVSERLGFESSPERHRNSESRVKSPQA